LPGTNAIINKSNSLFKIFLAAFKSLPSIYFLPDKNFKAQLTRKAGSIDNETTSEIWEFKVSNSDRQLLRGSYTDVKLHLIRPKKYFVVPTSAVVTTLERKFVVKVSDDTTKWVDIRSGFNMGDRQEIFGDLNEGDTLILKSSEELKEGKKEIPIIQNYN
jgi:hypothetical protein